MKPVYFVGTSREDLRDLPETVQETTGFQLFKVQQGNDPDDWKPMTTVGPGAQELRVRDESDMPISSGGEGRKGYDTRNCDEREWKYLPGSGVFGRAICRTHSQKQFTASPSGHDSEPRVEAGGGGRAPRDRSGQSIQAPLGTDGRVLG